MKKIKLPDGTPVYCIKGSEAIVLDDHVKGYFNHGITLEDGDVVFDVGANIGVFGLRASQEFKNLEIHGFEPVPQIFEVLKKNVELSKNEKFHAHHMGLSSKKDALKFTYFPNSPALSTANPEQWDVDPKAFQKAVKGSLKNSPDSFWWSRLIPGFTVPLIAWYLKRGKKEVECEVHRISDIVRTHKIEKISLLKIDCEGQEWEVLKGISEEDWPKVKSVVTEVHDLDGRVQNVVELLTAKGFTQIVKEKEKALESTELINVYAIR